ncbi:MAG TPA: hypothetical protein VFJ65_06810 [Solirubrobacterales bacterium]|nr:hypothetical protein [Solirubrobacterales bacterium]
MNYLKMTSFIAVAIACLITALGAAEASATVLCKTADGKTCKSGWGYESRPIHAVLDPGTGNAKITTTFKNVECGKSTIEATILGEGGATETIRAEVSVFSFEECNCEVKTLEKGTLEIHYTSGTNGMLTSNEAEFTVTCSTIFGNVHCIYVTANTSLGTITGGSPATVDVEGANIPRASTSALCSEKANLDAKYEITDPSPLYVSAET